MKHRSEQASSFIPHPSSFGRWGRLILGTLLVLTGLATAILTLMARRLGVPEFTTAGAIASLVLVLLIMVLVVPPLTRSAFAEMAATGFPIEVTTGGVIFVVILVIVGFAAWNTGNNLLFMVLSIMLSTIFVSWMAARMSLRDLNVQPGFRIIFSRVKQPRCWSLYAIRNVCCRPFQFWLRFAAPSIR